MVDTSSYIKAYGYYLYMWALYSQITLLFLISSLAGFFRNGELGFKEYLSEVYLYIALPAFWMFAGFSAMRLIIFLLENLRIVKKDNKVLYGLAVFFFYGVVMIAAYGLMNAV